MPLVLVVDDDPSLRTLLAFTLEGAGFSVQVASDGAAALAVLREGLQPDVVLLDLTMPDLDGLGVLVEMRRLALAPSARVVIVTGCVGEREFIRGFELGAAEYLTKPFDPETLVLRIQALLAPAH